MAASLARCVFRNAQISPKFTQVSNNSLSSCLGMVSAHSTSLNSWQLSCRFSCHRQLSSQVIQGTDPDQLYQYLDVEVKGHDPAVLESYEKFVSSTTRELDIDLMEVETPPKDILRRTLLKSAHVYKKHRVQYEIKTHFKIFKIKHITGSTASTFLEYIQRNLPEGVAMKVTKHRLETFPEHLTRPQEYSPSKE